jgi:hypothetical protein
MPAWKLEALLFGFARLLGSEKALIDRGMKGDQR